MRTTGSITEEQLVTIVEEAIEHGDTVRVGALKDFEKRIIGRGTALRRERARRVAKYGTDSAKTRTVELQIARNAEMRREIARAVTSADFRQPRADPKATILHGRIIDESRDPLPSVRVEVLDQAGATIASGETDAQGYYKLTIPPITPTPNLPGPEDSKRFVRIRVMDPKKNVLVDAATEIGAKAGSVSFRVVAAKVREAPSPSDRPQSSKPQEAAKRAQPAAPSQPVKTTKRPAKKTEDKS